MSETNTPRTDAVEAWLIKCAKPGKRITYASVDENDTLHWPVDQWTSIEKIPLVPASELVRAREELTTERTARVRAEAERDAAVKDAERWYGHAGAMRVWVGSQSWKVDEETTREAGLTLVALFDAAIARGKE